MSIREDFERDRHVGPRAGDGYCLSSDQEAWDIWQAAAALYREKRREEVEKSIGAWTPPYTLPIQVNAYYRGLTDMRNAYRKALGWLPDPPEATK